MLINQFQFSKGNSNPAFFDPGQRTVSESKVKTDAIPFFGPGSTATKR